MEAGKQRSPGIIILLFLVTLGVYWFVWIWKAFGEVERHKGADLKRQAFLIPMVLLFAGGTIVGGILAVEEFRELFEQLRTMEETGTPPPRQENPFFPEYTPLRFLQIGLGVAFYALQLFYLQAATRLVLSALPPGFAGPSTTMAVLFNIAFMVSQVPIVGILCAIAGLVLAIIWVVQIQQAMNRVWAIVASPPMPPMGFVPVQAPR